MIMHYECIMRLTNTRGVTGEVLPLGLAVAAWVAAAATVGGGFYVLFLHDDEKLSAESLTMRDCERDG
jgi:hypothetical protein